MSTKVSQFESGQGALTLFYDFIKDDKKNPSLINGFMKRVFPSRQEYIYKKADHVPDCSELIDTISESINNADAQHTTV